MDGFKGHGVVLRRLIEHRRSLIVFLVLLLIWVGLSTLPIKLFGDLGNEMVLTLVVISGFHLADRLFLQHEMAEIVRSYFDKITHTSASLDAMARSGIIRIYSSRTQAGPDIRDDLKRSKNEIRLMGISLNDFVLVGNREEPLHRAWEDILNRLNTLKSKPGDKCHVRMLIVDPDSYSAQMRSRAETDSCQPETLWGHVEAVAKRLSALMKQSSPNGVKLDCRLYRTGPQMFLCWTDEICYVQQYYFWPARDESCPVPVIRYRRRSESPDSITDMHEEMDKNFEWMWANASICLDDWLEGFSRGFDKGMYQSGAVNVFTDRGEAWRRMTQAIKGAKQRVWVQGNTLHSFFRPNIMENVLEEPLRQAVKAQAKEFSMRLLFLDKDSPQAEYRSFREHLLLNKIDFEEFQKRNMHQRSELYQHVELSVDRAQKLLEEHSEYRDFLKYKVYNTAGVGFILITDDVVFFEPYHYGKTGKDKSVNTLGGDMPLFEFHATVKTVGESKRALYDESPEKMLYALLFNHFEFAWDYPFIDERKMSAVAALNNQLKVTGVEVGHDVPAPQASVPLQPSAAEEAGSKK